MGLLNKLRNTLGGKPTESQAPPPVTTPRPTVAALARDLHRSHPAGVPPEVVRERAEGAGFRPETVERQLEQLRNPSPPAAPEPLRVRTVDVPALRVVDLSDLESVRTRIKGTSYCVTDAGRKRYGGTEYLLIPEPDNPLDPNTVAVYGKGRRVGYLSTARAATLAPMLAQMGADAYKVAGTGTASNSIVLWVDVPKADGLRRAAHSRRPEVG